MSVETEQVIADLYDVADDSEADVLEALRVKAGHLWKCRVDDCNWVNPRDEPKCDGCGSAKP